MKAVRYALLASTLIVLISTGISLSWSFLLGWLPCDLCWYERICMYPLCVIYGVSIIAKKNFYQLYSFPLLIVGLILSVYNYLLQVVPYMSNNFGCTSIVSCSTPEFRVFNFVTPPLLSLLSFSCLIIIDIYTLIQTRAWVKCTVNSVQ